MKLHTGIIIVLLLSQVLLKAQQFPISSFQALQGAVVNPAEAGSHIGVNSYLSHRQQWLGLSGRPKTSFLSVDGTVLKQKIGIGLSVVQDNLGRNSITSIKIPLAYRKRLGKYVLAFGFGPEIKLQSLKGDLVSVDPITSDEALANKVANASAIDFYSGVSLSSRTSYLGLAINKLLGSNVGNLNVENAPVILIRGGFNKVLSDNIEVLPTFQIKSDLKNVGRAQLDLQGLFRFKDQFLAGLNFRTGGALGPQIGWQKYLPSGKLLILYAFDYPLSPIFGISSGSHEIALNYIIRLSNIQEGEQYRNVRFL